MSRVWIGDLIDAIQDMPEEDSVTFYVLLVELIIILFVI